jgi:lipoyl synthase
MAEQNGMKGQLPGWLKVKVERGPEYQALKRIIKKQNLHTVCEEARCPNIWDCWNRRTATFMILGDICTRSCGFCAVKTGRPTELDHDEPGRVAAAVQALDLKHVVVTSVNRDELLDGGAEIFAQTVNRIREKNSKCTIEVLIPDFKGSEKALSAVLKARPDILNHNTETVPRLYSRVRPQARYDRSLKLLQKAKQRGAVTKTGLMLGLGESLEEVRAVMVDLSKIQCDILTLGQYLQPTKGHLPVSRYYHPDEFVQLKSEARALGFGHIESGPLVRSSYHADTQVIPLRGKV